MANKPAMSFNYYENSELKAGLPAAMRMNFPDHAFAFAVERDESDFGTSTWTVIFSAFFEDVGFADPNVLLELLALHHTWTEYTEKQKDKARARELLLYAVALICKSPKSRAVSDMTLVGAANTDMDILRGCLNDDDKRVDWSDALVHAEGSSSSSVSKHGDQDAPSYVNPSAAASAMYFIFNLSDNDYAQMKNSMGEVEMHLTTACHMILELDSTENRMVEYSPPKWVDNAIRNCPNHSLLTTLTGRGHKWYTKPASRAFRSMISAAEACGNRALALHLLCVLEVIARKQKCDRHAFVYAALLTARYAHSAVQDPPLVPLKTEIEHKFQTAFADLSAKTIAGMDEALTAEFVKGLGLYKISPRAAPTQGQDRKQKMADLSDMDALRQRRVVTMDPFYLTCDTYRGSGTNTLIPIEKKVAGSAWTDQDSARSHGPPNTADQSFASALVPPEAIDTSHVQPYTPESNECLLPGDDAYVPFGSIPNTPVSYLTQVLYSSARIPNHVKLSVWDVLMQRRSASLILAEEALIDTRPVVAALKGAPKSRKAVIESILERSHAIWASEFPDTAPPVVPVKSSPAAPKSKSPASSSSSSSSSDSGATNKKRKQAVPPVQPTIPTATSSSTKRGKRKNAEEDCSDSNVEANGTTNTVDEGDAPAIRKKIKSEAGDNMDCSAGGRDGGTGATRQIHKQVIDTTEPRMSEVKIDLGSGVTVSLYGSNSDISMLSLCSNFTITGLIAAPSTPAMLRPVKKEFDTPSAVSVHVPSSSSSSGTKGSAKNKRPVIVEDNYVDTNEDADEDDEPPSKSKKTSSAEQTDGPSQRYVRPKFLPKDFLACHPVKMTLAEEVELVTQYPLAQKPANATKKFVIVSPEYVYRGPFKTANKKDMEAVQRAMQRTLRLVSYWKDPIALPQDLVYVVDEDDKTVLRYYVRGNNVGNRDKSSWKTTDCTLKTHEDKEVSVLERSAESSGVVRASEMTEAALASFGRDIAVHLCAVYLLGCGDPGLSNVLVAHSNGVPSAVYGVDIDSVRELVRTGPERTLAQLLFVSNKTPPKPQYECVVKTIVKHKADILEFIRRVREEDIGETNKDMERLGYGKVSPFEEPKLIGERCDSLEAVLAKL